MKKAITAIAIIIIILAFYLILEPEPNVCFNKKCFQVKLAETAEERATGLMYRTSLPKDQGMLFIFNEESERNFWMKNTFIPLDIIFLNKNLEVTKITTAEPCKIDICPTYKGNARYILEINANLSKENKIEINQKASLKQLRKY